MHTPSPAAGPATLVRKVVGLLCFVALAAPRAGQAPPPSAAVEPPPEFWCHDMATPVELSDETLNGAARAVFAALRNGTPPELATIGLTAESAPRGVFISVSDGTGTATTAYGAGRGVEAAIRAAVGKARQKGLMGNTVRWLKLDVVQLGGTVGDFRIRESRVPLPGLLGLGFAPESGLVFLPEELVARDMIDSQLRLTIHYIGEQLADTKDFRKMGWWLGITSYRGAQAVCTFETQSAFCDGTEAVPLFRGHRLYDLPTPDEMAEAAARAAAFVAAGFGREGGFKPPFIQWVTDPDGAVPAPQKALAALALVRMFKATGNETYRDGAKLALDGLLDGLTRFGASGKAICIVESRHVLRLASLETNCLAILALTELEEKAPEKAYRQELTGMAHYLMAQRLPNGEFAPSRMYPSGRPETVPEIRINGLALLSLLRLYEYFGDDVFLRVATAAAETIRKGYLEDRAMDALPTDAWLVEALDWFFTFGRDEELVTTIHRIALAAAARQERRPEFPDEFGAPGTLPSSAVAADNARILAAAARLLRDTGHEQAADDLLADARPFVIFQLQTRMTPPEAMYLPEPQRYLGLFRDHLRLIGFDLGGQATQILGLLAMAEQVRRAPGSNFPRGEAVDKALAEARRRMNAFPRFVTAFAVPGSAPGAEAGAVRPIPGGGAAPLPGAPDVRPVPKRGR